jgi:hypothetical protein
MKYGRIRNGTLPNEPFHVTAALLRLLPKPNGLGGAAARDR